MKGTLFSADFVKDSAGNLRLLEFNTDTGILQQELNNFDFTQFLNIIEENNISELDLIYKSVIHTEFVNSLSSSVTANLPRAITLNLHEEDVNTIYPTLVEDSPNKFILRLAYDESALFDSEYCKTRLNVFNLFTENSITDYCVSYYHSSSLGEFNTLTKELNGNNLPDATIKDINEYYNPINFFKIGSETTDETIEDRWNNFLSENTSDDTLIEQFHFHSSSLDSNNHITSVRFFGIVYGSNLEIIPLHSYKISSIFDLPTNLLSEINLNQYTNKLANYHYYEFVTNFTKADSNGLLSTHEILSNDDLWKPIGEYEVGESVKSYYFPRYDESNSDAPSYTYEGNQFPSGSFITASAVVYKKMLDLRYNSMIELKVDNDSIFSGLGKSYIISNSNTNISSFSSLLTINPQTDYLYDLDGNLISIDELNFYVSTDSNLKFVELDVEDTDTYIISGSTSFNTIVTHNSPCFVAGTQILLENGLTKNIEDVIVGDCVVSFDFKNNQLVSSNVLNLFSKKIDKVVEYEFLNGTKLKATLDHPIYVINKGWSSYSDELSNNLYKLETPIQKIQLNDVVKFNNEESELINVTILDGENIVYNLSEIDIFHNYFANGVLVHNRRPPAPGGLVCFISGTQISMADGSEKNIEDVVIGDEVLSYNEDTGVIEPKKVIKLNSPIHDDLVEYTLSNGITITSTFDHPYYVNGLQLASYQPDWTNERYELPSEVGKIKVGDFVNLANKEIVEIISIVELDRVDTQTYIISVEDNRNFYANQILVHNK